MSFLESIRICFSKYKNFKGRARRSEYWYFSLFNSLVSFVIIVVINTPESDIINGFKNLIFFIPNIAVTWRRLHDTGRSGLNFLWIFTGIGLIPFFIWLCLDSEHKTNKYGHSPKLNRDFDNFNSEFDRTTRKTDF